MDESPDALHATLARLLRRTREAAGLTQDQLSAASGVGRAYISNLEVGWKSPSLATLGKLAGVFGVEVSTLVKAAEEGNEEL